jgi:long-subunit acyl-CoA synthetase (AMP-forming)
MQNMLNLHIKHQNHCCLYGDASMAWVRARLCKLQKGCTRLTTASDQVYQLLAHVRWFSPGTPASSTTKTGRYDIAEI